MVSITPEQVEALAHAEGGRLHLHDPRTNKVYLLVEEASVPEADAEHIEYMRRGLEEAEHELAEGLGIPWDQEATDAIRHEGLAKLKEQEGRAS